MRKKIDKNFENSLTGKRVLWVGKGISCYILQRQIRLFSLYGNVILVCILNRRASHIESVIACTPDWRRKGISYQRFHIHYKVMLPMVLNERVRQLLYISTKKHTFILSYVRSVSLLHIIIWKTIGITAKFLKNTLQTFILYELADPFFNRLIKLEQPEKIKSNFLLQEVQNQTQVIVYLNLIFFS